MTDRLKYISSDGIKTVRFVILVSTLTFSLIYFVYNKIDAHMLDREVHVNITLLQEISSLSRQLTTIRTDISEIKGTLSAIRDQNGDNRAR